MYRFWINCRPPRSTGQATKKVVCTKEWQTIQLHECSWEIITQHEFMSLLMPYVPLKPLEGPLCMEVRYALPFLKTERKAIKGKGMGVS